MFSQRAGPEAPLPTAVIRSHWHASGPGSERSQWTACYATAWDAPPLGLSHLALAQRLQRRPHSPHHTGHLIPRGFCALHPLWRRWEAALAEAEGRPSFVSGAGRPNAVSMPMSTASAWVALPPPCLPWSLMVERSCSRLCAALYRTLRGSTGRRQFTLPHSGEGREWRRSIGELSRDTCMRLQKWTRVATARREAAFREGAVSGATASLFARRRGHVVYASRGTCGAASLSWQRPMTCPSQLGRSTPSTSSAAACGREGGRDRDRSSQVGSAARISCLALERVVGSWTRFRFCSVCLQSLLDQYLRHRSGCRPEVTPLALLGVVSLVVPSV